MAKPKFSGIGVVDINGSISNTTFARNRYGTYSKQRIGAPASTTYLQDRQLLMAALENLWQNTLDDNDRAEWARYEITKRNRMATRNSITGHEAFISVNFNRALISFLPLLLPYPYKPAPQIDQPTLTSPAANQLFYQLSGLDISLGAVAIYVSAPLPVGRMSANQIYLYTGYQTANGTHNLTADYTTRVTAPPSGSKIFVKFVPISSYNGQRGQAKFASVIIS